jgi:signal transduction histidine kinase
MTVTSRVSIYIFLIIFIFAGYFALHTISSKIDTFHIIERAQIQIVENIFKDIPSKIYMLMDEHYSMLSADTELLKAIANKDKKSTAELGEKYLQNLMKWSEGARVSLNIHLQDTPFFYQFASPHDHDCLAHPLRPMVKKALDAHKIQRGFEVGEESFFQRSIYPLYIEGIMIGLVEYGIDADYVAHRINSITNIKTSLRLYKDYITKLGYGDDYTEVNGYYEIFNNSPELFEVADKEGDRAFSHEKRSYALIQGFEVHDFEGAHIGEFVFLSDRTDLTRWIVRYIVTVSFMMLVLLAVIYLIVKHKIIPMVSGMEQNYIKLNRELTETNRKLEQMVKDAVEKNRRQEELLHSQHKLVDMGRMINAIAHHWRQPLNALGLYVQDIADSYKSEDCSLEYVETFEKDSMRMIQNLSTTIDDFRNFFKTGSDVKEEFDLITEVVTMMRLMHSQMDHNMIDYKMSCRCGDVQICEPDITDMRVCKTSASRVFGLKAELKQVLVNIVNNSIDAILTSRGDSHRRGLLNLDIVCMENMVTVLITDNGGGIPDEIAGLVFDPYFTTKEVGQGTGLGLYMSKVVIEQHFEGRLSYSNTADGCTFKVQIPIVSAR